jgi:hypothetical protein
MISVTDCRRLPEPCADCPQPEGCWNYGKEPDPDNPGGKWKTVGWFDCDRQTASVQRPAVPEQLT